MIHKLNPGGHKVVRATLPAAKMILYTILSNCGPLPLKKSRGRENLKRKMENENERGEVG
jgi:hypothetical protein